VVRPPDRATVRRPAVLVLADASKDTFVAEGGLAAEFARSGFIFAAADLRGRHQCLPHPPQRGPRYYFDRGEDFYVWDTLVLGKPMLGGYVRDALETLACLRGRPDVDPSHLSVIGQGTMGVVALFVLALDPGLRGGIIEGALTDYRSIVENDHYTTPFRIFLPGVLKHFDLPELAAMIAPRPLLLLNPMDQAGQRRDAAAVQALYPSAAVRAGVAVTAKTYLDALS